jgi:adenylate cyclase
MADNPPVQRRLAAILAADVAGYSRLMGADEEGTLGRLKALRAALIDPAVAGHHGRIVKTTGDGLLVEFASVVDAMRCAIEWQATMVERAETGIEWRIGVNLGDIIIERRSCSWPSKTIRAFRPRTAPSPRAMPIWGSSTKRA